jgi:[protein-PII] uridylyltransferase
VTNVNAGPGGAPGVAPPLTALNSARAELRAAADRGLGGRAALGRYAERVDVMLRQLFAEVPPAARPVAVIALGGYGRRELCLHSDIDLLILFDGTIGPADETFVGQFLNPLWDLGVVVGHQVRELEELSELEVDNPEFLLALLDARLLAGDRRVFERFLETFHQPAVHAQILAMLVQLVEARHQNFNDTLYQLEPDVKDAPGALRDLTAARTIAALTDPTLLMRGPVDGTRLDEAADYLLRVRLTLHLETGRNHNVLTHELQEKTAERLGYPGLEPHQRVERMMSEYFRHARLVTQSLQWTRKAAPTPVGPNLGRSYNGIRFIDLARAAQRPETWLLAFQAAIDEHCEVSEYALSVMRQNVHKFAPGDFFPTTAERDALLRFLTPKPGLYARLSEMHDAGVLGQMFPEFQAISWRVVRDFFHKYTVDEHTLLTIRNLERLAAPPGPATSSRSRFGGLLRELEHPELLVLALLFHDVGKWRDEDHAVESVRMAHQMLTRLQVSAEASEVVDFLIRHHLRMSRAAFHRDTEDPEIVKEFAALVGIEERLKMLCLLTLVDIEAVSPDTLTPWKEDLLWRLYVDTYNHLTHAYGDELINRRQAELSELLAHRPSDVAAEEMERFLEGFPRRYLRLATPEAIYGHVRLSRDIGPEAIHISLEQKGPVWELTVATLDKPFLFSNICGVLSSFGMDILRGHAMTSPSHLVLDIVQFTDDERFFELNPGGQKSLCSVLENVVAGRSDVRERLRRREQSLLHRRAPFRRPPVVHGDNEASSRYTVLEIDADDSQGLLYRISRVISRTGYDVHLVLISTEGHRAIDVFHITQGGAKLSEAAERQLASDLQHMLEGTDEVA